MVAHISAPRQEHIPTCQVNDLSGSLRFAFGNKNVSTKRRGEVIEAPFVGFSTGSLSPVTSSACGWLASNARRGASPLTGASSLATGSGHMGLATKSVLNSWNDSPCPQPFPPAGWLPAALHRSSATATGTGCGRDARAPRGCCPGGAVGSAWRATSQLVSCKNLLSQRVNRNERISAKTRTVSHAPDLSS